MDPVLFGLFAIVVLFVGYGVLFAVWRAAADRTAGVTAEWEGLRITATELIEGYRRRAKRHPCRASVHELRSPGPRDAISRVSVPGASE